MPVAAAPRLLRTIAESTQPYGPLDASPGLHALEEYLQDQDSVGAVFKGIMQRAAAEPLSLGIIDKCVALLKRGLPRYPASPEILAEVIAFCDRFQLLVGSSSSGTRRSLVYLQALARQLGKGKVPAPAPKSVSGPSHARIASDPMPAAAPLAEPPAVLMEPVSRAMSTPVLSAPRPPRPASKGAASGSVSSLPSPLAVASEHGAASMATSLATNDAYGIQAGAMHHNVLEAQWSSPQQAANASRDSVWQEFLPSLGAAYPADGEQEGLPEDMWLGQAALREQVDIVVGVQRARAARISYPDGLEAGRLRAQQQWRPGMLFQHQPYIDQEPLQLTQREVGAVLDVVCGTAGTSSPFEDLASEEWQQGSVHAGAALISHPGPVCAGILIKLILDLWLQNAGAQSFPLALVMLHRALASEQAIVRARGFDIVYNLAVHAELLSTSEAANIAEQIEEDAWGEKAARAETGAQAVHRSLLDSAKLPSDKSEGGGHSAGLFQWLRLLLFELLAIITQRKETEEQVWLSALGCLLHMTFVQGQPARHLLAGFPLQSLAELLTCCTRFHWPSYVRIRLVRLAVNLLYHTPAPSEDDDDAGSAQESRSSLGRIPDTPTAATLRLVVARLDTFGGISRVAAEFQAAACLEERCNWFSILLDYTATMQDDLESRFSGSKLHPSALRHACSLLASPLVVDAVCTAFNVGQLGYAPRIAAAVSSSAQELDQQEEEAAALQATLERVLERLGSLANFQSQGSLPPALQPALDHTLSCIDEDAEAQEEEDLDAPNGTVHAKGIKGGIRSMLGPVGPADEVWACLCELLCSNDPWAGKLGTEWFYLLVLTAAQHHLQLVPDANLRQDVALLPCPPEAVSRSPMGIAGQTRLAKTLSTILVHDSSDANTASRFFQVVSQLLLCVKLQCTLSPGLKGTIVDNSQQYNADCAATLILNTLFVAVEWLILAQPSERQKAYMQAAELLLVFLCGQLSTLHVSASLTPDHPPNVAASGPTGAAAILPTYAAFLEGASSVPQDLLHKVSPVMLARLLQGLAPLSSAPQQLSEARMHIKDLRLAVLLLLLGRCFEDDLALAQAGGEGMVVDLLSDDDARMRHHAASFLQARILRQRPETWRRALRQLLPQAQQQGDDKLLRAPYLQLAAMLDMQLVTFTP